MCDRILRWIKTHVDLGTIVIDEAALPPASALDSSYNHPPDVTATDELVSRLCLMYYQRYGLTLVGLVKHHGLTPALEENYLAEVHECSTQLEAYMPHRHEHEATVRVLTALHQQGVPLFLFSNAHADHVDRVLDHIGLSPKLFSGTLEYRGMRDRWYLQETRPLIFLFHLP